MHALSPRERKGSLKNWRATKNLGHCSRLGSSRKRERLGWRGWPLKADLLKLVLYTEHWNHMRSVSKPQATPRPFTGDSLGRDLALGFLKAPLSFQCAAKVEHLCFKPNKQTKHWTISPSPNVFWLSGLESGSRKNNIVAVLSECTTALQTHNLKVLGWRAAATQPCTPVLHRFLSAP